MTLSMELQLTHLKKNAEPVINSALMLQRACACGNHALGGKCGSCSAKGQLQKPFAGQFDDGEARSIVPRISSGLGADFSGVQPYNDQIQRPDAAGSSKN